MVHESMKSEMRVLETIVIVVYILALVLAFYAICYLKSYIDKKSQQSALKSFEKTQKLKGIKNSIETDESTVFQNSNQDEILLRPTAKKSSKPTTARRSSSGSSSKQSSSQESKTIESPKVEYSQIYAMRGSNQSPQSTSTEKSDLVSIGDNKYTVEAQVHA